MKKIFILELLKTNLLIGSILSFALPINAQIVELGDGVRIDFSSERRRHRRTNIRMYPENGRLNVGLEEERKPQTRIRIFNRDSSPSIDIRRESSPTKKRVRLSLPF